MSRFPARTGALLPDRYVAILGPHGVAAEVYESKAVSEPGVELRLELIGSHSMAQLPRRQGAVLPDHAEALTCVAFEGADVHGPIPTGAQVVDGQLVIGSGQSVPGLQRRPVPQFPDTAVEFLISSSIPEHSGRPVSLGLQLVELGLIAAGVGTVPGLPLQSGGVGDPDVAVAVLAGDPVSGPVRQTVAARGQIIEMALKRVAAEAMMGFPGDRAGLLPKRRIMDADSI